MKGLTRIITAKNITGEKWLGMGFTYLWTCLFLLMEIHCWEQQSLLWPKTMNYSCATIEMPYEMHCFQCFFKRPSCDFEASSPASVMSGVLLATWIPPGSWLSFGTWGVGPGAWVLTCLETALSSAHLVAIGLGHFLPICCCCNSCLLLWC